MISGTNAILYEHGIKINYSSWYSRLSIIVLNSLRRFSSVLDKHYRIGFSSVSYCIPSFSASLVLAGAEQTRSRNTWSSSLKIPISTQKCRHQQATSRLSAPRFMVNCGTSFEALKWSIHSSMLLATFVPLGGLSFTHRLN